VLNAGAFHRRRVTFDSSNETPTRQRHILLLLVFLHTLNTYMDRVCISSAANDIKADLHLSDQTMGHVFAMFAVGTPCSRFLPARCRPLWPPRVLTGIVGLWSVFTVLTGTAFNALWLLVVRFLFGVGEAGAFQVPRGRCRPATGARARHGPGIFHSGARVGAVLSLFSFPWLIAPSVGAGCSSCWA